MSSQELVSLDDKDQSIASQQHESVGNITDIFGGVFLLTVIGFVLPWLLIAFLIMVVVVALLLPDYDQWRLNRNTTRDYDQLFGTTPRGQQIMLESQQRRTEVLIDGQPFHLCVRTRSDP